MKGRVIERAFVVVIAALIAVTLAVPTFAAAQEKKPIVIGGSLPLTGKFAETGIWIERGMKYWLEEVHKKGGLLGRPVELKIYDDESNVSKASPSRRKPLQWTKLTCCSVVIQGPQLEL